MPQPLATRRATHAGAPGYATGSIALSAADKLQSSFGSGRRHEHLDLKAAVAPGCCADVAAVRLCNGTDDGEPEAGAAAVVDPRTRMPPEWLEECRHVLGGYERAGVRDAQRRGVTHLHPDAATGLVVLDRVLDQVRHEPFEQDRLAHDRAR